MEALGPGGDRASPASSTRSLDLRRLSARADSAYSSFSAASGGPEPHTPSPGTDLPYLDWDYVRVVWGGPAPPPPSAGPRTSSQSRPAAAARSGPRPPEVQGTPGPLSRQATPLLYALAAEAEAAARAAEPPSPPASRAAYRQRLQGAQRRVLRETSFQRKELRMSLPARLRPAAPARPPAAHLRSASLSHPAKEVEQAPSAAPAPGTAGRGRLANQQRTWCFSEPGKLDRVGRGGGLAGECSGETCSSSGLSRPEPQVLQCQALAEFEGHQINWPPETQPRGIEDPEPPSLKLGNASRPASLSRSTSGEALAPRGGPGEVMPIVQVWKIGPAGLGWGASGRLKTCAIFHPSVCLSRQFPKEQKPPDHCFRPNFPGERHGLLWGLSWGEAAFIAPAQERSLPPTPSLSIVTLSFANHIPYCPPPNPPLPKRFLPGHCGQCGVPAFRFLTQKEAAVVCPAEGPQSCPADCEQRLPETCLVSTRLPSLPDDDVFLEEAPLVRMRSPTDSHAPAELPTR